MARLSDLDCLKLTAYAATPDIRNWLGDGSPFTDDEIRHSLLVAFTEAQDAFERGKVLEAMWWPVDEDLITILMACARTFNAIKLRDFGSSTADDLIRHASEGAPPPPPEPKVELTQEGNITHVRFHPVQ